MKLGIFNSIQDGSQPCFAQAKIIRVRTKSSSVKLSSKHECPYRVYGFLSTLPGIVLYGGHLSTLGRTENEWRIVCLDLKCQITSGRLGVRSQSWSYLSVTVWRGAGPHPYPRDNNPCPVVRRQIKPHRLRTHLGCLISNQLVWRLHIAVWIILSGFI